MPDMIFPTTQRELGSEKNINLISSETLLEKIAEIKSQGNGMKLPADILAKIAAGKAPHDDDCECDDCCKEKKEESMGDTKVTVEAKRALPEALREHMFKSKGDKGKDKDKVEDKDKDEEDGELIKRGKSASTRVHKVLFSSPDSLSAEALEADLAAGRTDIYQARLAARNNNRIKIANRIMELTNEQTQKAQKLAKKSDYRMTVVSDTKKAAEKLATTKNTVKSAVSIRSSVTADKLATASVLRQHGYQEDYIKQIVGLNDPEITIAESRIRKVMASAIDKDTIRMAVAGLVKTANLSAEQLDRCKDYWKNELHYGDPEWIDDLYSNKFSDSTSNEDTTV